MTLELKGLLGVKKKKGKVKKQVIISLFTYLKRKSCGFLEWNGWEILGQLNHVMSVATQFSLGIHIHIQYSKSCIIVLRKTEKE